MKIEDLKADVESLPPISDDYGFMKDPKNWCLVRCTDVMPIRDENGNYIMQSQLQGTGFTKGRQTLSMTLNHVVNPVPGDFASWNGTSYVVVMPYEDTVKNNGDPISLGVAESVFIPDPDKGLLLPESVCIVQPASENDSELYTIGEHVATYKTNNFTDDEINGILQLLDPYKLEEYNRLLRGDLSDSEIAREILANSRVKRGYENATDKKKFLSGLMYEDRMTILTCFLRNFVVSKVMANKGFKTVNGYDMSSDDEVANYAMQHNISTAGHVFSIADILEECGNDSIKILDDLESFGSDVKKIYQYITTTKIDSWGVPLDQLQVFAQSIESGRLVNFYEMYENALIKIPYKFPYKSVYEYAPRLSEVVRRFCRQLSHRYLKWVYKLTQDRCYDLLQNKFRKRSQYMARQKYDVYEM